MTLKLIEQAGKVYLHCRETGGYVLVSETLENSPLPLKTGEVLVVELKVKVGVPKIKISTLKEE